MMESPEVFRFKKPYDRLCLVRESSKVKRFHTVVVNREQNVGEHTFNVIALIDFIDPLCDKKLWRAALHHDVLESITGDIPATTKWKYPEFSEALTAVEKKLERDYGLDEDVLYSDDRKLLDYADAMECLLYCLDEMSHGNKTAAIIASRLFTSIEGKKLQKYNMRSEWLYDLSVTRYEALGGNRE